MHPTRSDDVVVSFPRPATDLATWRTVMRCAMVPMDIEELPQVAFRGHFQYADVDGVLLFQMATTAHVVRRSQAAISSSDTRYYKMSLQLAGQAYLEQDERIAELHPGDLAIYDTHRPYTLTFPETSQALVMIIPQSKVSLSPEQLSSVTTTVFPSGGGLGRMINPFFVELGKNLEHLTGSYASRLVRSAVDLMETLLVQEVDSRFPCETSTVRHLGREVQDYIQEHLSDADMTPASIAAHHFISLRHLYTVFAEEGHTVSAWIRARRLEKIRRDLTDPLYSQRTVSWIASKWGLHDAAHFSRVFKAEYGVAPSAYRRLHQQHQLTAVG